MGHVSVENNHVDVFVFELAQCLIGSQRYNEPRFIDFVGVISLPCGNCSFEGHMCGIARRVITLKWYNTPTGIMERTEKGFITIYLLPGGRLLRWELLSRQG